MLHLISLLLACAGGPPRDTGLAPDACEPSRRPPRVEGLPASATWASTERTYATGLGWGDVNGDGWRDLVVASGNDVVPGPVSVHLGRADGTLSRTPDARSAEDHFHGHLAIGDVDGDGYDDVVAARYLGPGGFGDPGGVDLYRGGPEGLEATPSWSVDGFASFDVALGDVDGDGDLDLAVATGEVYDGIASPDLVFENVGGALSHAPIWESAPSIALAVVFVDHDLDGDLDLVFARSGAPHVRYDNDGGLADAPSWQAPGDTFDGNGLDFGDVDGDGRPDLLVSDNTYGDGPGTVRLFCGEGWATCWTGPDAGVPWSAVSLVDVDGDDDLDAVVGSWWGPVEVFDNRDGALAQASWATDTTSVIEAFAWHDLDGGHEEPGCAEGVGLVAIPRGARVVRVEPPGAAVGDGYVSAPGAVRAQWLRSRQLDLAVSNWDPEIGTWVLGRD